MSILTDKEIIKAVERGDIVIKPFVGEREYIGGGKYSGALGPNSYDLTLNEKLLVYDTDVLDMRKDNPVREIIIPEEGYILEPGILYLGKTNEYTFTDKYVPIVEGRSSTARLGISVHDAGFGDIGFRGEWTLEITVTHPVRIYPNTCVCQIYYNTIEGKSLNKYNGKYQGSTDVVPSKMYKDEKFESGLGLDLKQVSDEMKRIAEEQDDIPVITSTQKEI